MTTEYIELKANLPILKFECSSNAKAVILITIKDHLYDLTSIPRCVEHIKFDYFFNQIIRQDDLPAELKSIVFGTHFNQPIDVNVLPAGLQSIQFGHYFNQEKYITN